MRALPADESFLPALSGGGGCAGPLIGDGEGGGIMAGEGGCGDGGGCAGLLIGCGGGIMAGGCGDGGAGPA